VGAEFRNAQPNRDCDWRALINDTNKPNIFGETPRDAIFGVRMLPVYA